MSSCGGKSKTPSYRPWISLCEIYCSYNGSITINSIIIITTFELPVLKLESLSIILCFHSAKFVSLLNPLRAEWPMEPALISGFCSVKKMRVFDSPGQDTNPSLVSSQQTLVLIYLPRKDGKLSWLRRKRRLHKYSNLGKAEDQTGDLVARKQRSYQLCQPRPPNRHDH